MVALDTIRTQALALPGTEEAIHFKLVVFGVGKRNFATFDPRSGVFSLRLPATNPTRDASVSQGLLTTAPGKYGADGWAAVDLDRIDASDFAALLESAHRHLGQAPSKPAGKRGATKTRHP